jgi:hypothetical protein
MKDEDAIELFRRITALANAAVVNYNAHERNSIDGLSFIPGTSAIHEQI